MPCIVSDIFSKDIGFCLRTGFPFLISMRDDFSGLDTDRCVSQSFSFALLLVRLTYRWSCYAPDLLDPVIAEIPIGLVPFSVFVFSMFESVLNMEQASDKISMRWSSEWMSLCLTRCDEVVTYRVWRDETRLNVNESALQVESGQEFYLHNIQWHSSRIKVHRRHQNIPMILHFNHG